jgi:hypothetical protein
MIVVKSLPLSFVLGFVLALTSQGVWAETGSDALLQAVGGTQNSPVNQVGNSTAPAFVLNEIKLNNSVARSLFADWSATSNQGSPHTIETAQWVQSFFKDQFENYAHLWGAMSEKVPSSMSTSARAAYLYSLYQVNTPQTFFDEWMQSMANPEFASHKASTSLEEAISAQFDQWFLDSEISMTSQQQELIKKIGFSRSPVFLALNAATLRKKGEAAVSILEKLPLNSAFRPWLAQTVAVSYAKKGDLANAAKILKIYYEPWLMSVKDPGKLATHYLAIARLLYQAGALDGATQYYEKIPNGIPEYLTAREELTWVWLRLGQTEKLRGNLKTLTSQVLDNQFQPEAYLVRAVSNLKLCFYQSVEQDFADFIRVNASWAQKIDQGLKEAIVPEPRKIDIYSQASLKALSKRDAELKTLEGLSARSVAAVIPAVGPQKHWAEAIQRAQLAREYAVKLKNEEFRRQWKNDRITLNEAIRKMQFVKVELLSQVSEIAQQKSPADDQIKLSAASATAGKKFNQEGQMVFPFDGVIWPDELFKLRSVTQGRCLGQ